MAIFLFSQISIAVLLIATLMGRSTAFLGPIAPRCSGTKVSLQSTVSSDSEGGSTRVIRILALHGSEETADGFTHRLEETSFLKSLAENHQVQLDITAVQAPFPKGDGFAWWTMKPGERSYTATEYGGYDTSVARVLEKFNNDEASSHFDLVLGHSQGAILIAALLATGKVPYHPTIGYILNGVGFPNPLQSQVESLQVANGTAPRVLFVVGTNDKITPNETGFKLRDAFQKAGMQVATIQHPGGHGIPSKPDTTANAILEWITSNFHASNDP